jgi:hypothetical protein
MTAKAKIPVPPAGLEVTGKALWRAMLADLEAEPWETAILTAACRQADQVAKLERLIAKDGLMIEGSTGQLRIHPAITEAHLGRQAVARLLAQLHLVDDPEADVGRSPKSRRASHAATTRWNRVARIEDYRRSSADA